MKVKVNSEFIFTTKLSEKKTIMLIVYIDYRNETYDFIQCNEEGIFPRKNNTDVEINTAYFRLAIEVLDFINTELYER